MRSGKSNGAKGPLQLLVLRRRAPRALVPVERSVAEDRRYTVVHHGRPEMLDHILVSHGLMAYYRRFEVHNEALGDELAGFAEVRHDPASYHAPVAAEFALAGGVT